MHVQRDPLQFLEGGLALEVKGKRQRCGTICLVHGWSCVRIVDLAGAEALGYGGEGLCNATVERVIAQGYKDVMGSFP